ncbi:hypothetical protein IKO18_03845 [bacterium]|nr:hypothetical protein [bacterium]
MLYAGVTVHADALPYSFAHAVVSSLYHFAVQLLTAAGAAKVIAVTLSVLYGL